MAASAPSVLAIFGPTGVGKTRWPSPSPSGCARAASGRSRCRPTRCRSTRASRRSPACRRPPSARASSTGWSRSCPSTRASRSASTPSWRTRRSTRCSRRARTRSWSAAPACTCGRRSPSSTCARRPRRGPRALGGRAGAARARGAACRARAPRAVGRPSPSIRVTAAGSCACSSSRAGRARAAPGAQPAVDLRHAPSHAPGRPGHGPRCALRAHRRPGRRDGGRGRRARGARAPHAAGASETARKALGFDELLAGDVEAMKRRTRNLARRQLTWMRKLAGVEVIDVDDRDPGRWPRCCSRRRDAEADAPQHAVVA